MADGSINQLNFEVILKDSNFEARLKSLQGIAQAFNTSMSNALQISKVTAGTAEVNKLDKALKSASEGAKNLNTNLKAMPVNSMTKLSSETKNASAQMSNMRSTLSVISQLTGAAFSVIGLRRFLSTLIDVTGQFEVQKMALRNMLQDVEAADRIFQQLYEFSSRSTYRFSELAKYSKQLAAFNISKDSLLETTKMLGDVASGVGVSMDRLILAYGHVKSSGFLRGIQLRSFSQNGVPILEELSKMFTEIEGKAVSLGDVFDKMMKRRIPFEMVEEAFKRMTSEGGKFYRMQEVLAQTLAGQINILKGKWENMMYAVGQSQEGLLKGTVQALTGVVNHLDQIVNVMKPVIVGFGAYGAVLLSVAAAQKALGLARFAKYFVLLAQRTNIATAAVRVFGTASKAAAVGIGLAVTAIAAMVMVIRKSTDEISKFREHLDEIHKTARDGSAYDKEISELDSLRKILNDTNNTYDARKAALDRIKSIVPSYHADLTEEGKLINNNTKELDAYIDALQREAKMKGAQDELVELYKERRNVLREMDERQKAVDERNSASPAPGYITPAGKTPLENALVPGQFNNTKEKLTELDKRIESINKEIAETFNQGQEGANGMIYNITSITEGIKNIDSELTKLRNKAKKSGISVVEKEQLDALEAQRDEQVKLYKDIMGVKYDKAVRAGETAQAKAIKERINGIKDEIQLVQKYKQTYESFVALIGEEGARELTGKIYKDANITNYDFTSQIVKLTQALRTLGDEAGADSVLASLGLGEGKEIEKNLKHAQQVAKTYRNLMEAWTAKDTDADDDTFYGKMTKIVSDLNTKSNELFLKFKKGKELFRTLDATDPMQKRAVIQGLMDEGMTEDAANEFWDTFVEKGETALTELYVKNLAKLKTNAQQSVNALASTWVKEQTKGLSLTDWGDKSIGQVRDLYKTLKELAEGEGIDDKMKQKLGEMGLAIEDFTKSSKEEFSKLTEEAKKELIKKLGATLKQLATDLTSTVNALKDFAEASGKDGLAGVIGELQGVIPIFSTMAERLTQGDWIGAVVAGVTGVANRLLNAATEAAKFNAQLREAREESRRLRNEEALSQGMDSVFGSNVQKSIENAVNLADKLRKSMRSRQGDEFGRQAVKELGWIAKEMGRDLYDAYGNLNAETLRAMLDSYSKLSKAGKEWIQQAINDSELYAEAMEQLDSVIESIIGDIASSAADTLVDGWIEAGKAALDYADILDDVAKSYSKMLVKSMIIDSLEENTQAIKRAFANNDYQTAMSLVNDAMAQIEQMAPGIEEILSAFDPYFKREESERTASSKGLVSNFSQDTIDYWSGQLTLLVQYARRGDEQREAITNLVMALRDNMGGGGNGDYTSNVQTYLATIQGDTTAIRGDIYAMKLAIQNMNDKGVKML